MGGNMNHLDIDDAELIVNIVSEELKIRFPNLTVKETLDLSFKIVKRIRGVADSAEIVKAAAVSDACSRNMLLRAQENQQ